MKTLPLLCSGAILACGLLLSASLSYGKAEYTKTEKKPCKTCHVQAMPKTKEQAALNDVGKCYEQKKSLKDCLK